MIRRFLTLALALALTFTTTLVASQPRDGQQRWHGPGLIEHRMFGKGRVFRWEELPQSRLRKRLENLPATARNRAMRWLQERVEFPEQDADSMMADDDGAVYYVDPAPTNLPATVEQAVGTDGPLPLLAADAAGDAFVLHSRPGAPSVLYLDFDGHASSGTAWSSDTLFARAFDLDGNTVSFNSAEHAAIAEIWHRVAEDFAAFDIDVTTEEPPSFGPYTGRALITSKTQTNGASMPHNGAGGVAYVGVWGYSNYASYYSPALIYYDNLSSHTPAIAEVVSHEIGHNLGLSHDGTSSVTYYSGHGSGNTSWAPIMGRSYPKNVTQWSKGEYAGANNTQDDIAIITTALAVAADDHGDTLNGATPLAVDSNGDVPVSNPELDPHNEYPQNKGVIETRSDQDVFSFTASAGVVDLTLNPAWDAFYRTSKRGANLDIRARLLDASGQTIAGSNPTSETHATLTASVPTGTYFLEVSGDGNSNSSDYASNGQYFISGSVPSGSVNAAPTANFDFGCMDLNCSFTDNSSDSDGSIASWSWSFGDGAGATVRNPSHSYASAGTYTVLQTVTDNSGATATAQNTVTVVETSNLALTVGTIDAGAYGNDYGSDQHATELLASFQGTDNDLSLSVTGYDIDFNDEVAVYLNGSLLGYLSRGPNNDLNQGNSFSIFASQQLAGENIIRFVEKTAGWIWGVTNLLLSQTATPHPNPNVDVVLTVGTMDTGAYGNGYGSDQHSTELLANFQGTGSDLTLSATGYDIDFNDEVAVYFNGNFLGYLSQGPNNDLNQGNSFSIFASQQLAGENIIRFAEKTAGWIWGVTDLKIRP